MTTYHHGNLPEQLLTEAAAMAAEVGPARITLRELARRAGVSHSAPVHHFKTLRGLLTALAISGFESLTGALQAGEQDIYAMGARYVEWALAHPGHYAVMWQPALLDEVDSSLRASKDSAWEALSTTVAESSSARDAETAQADAYAAFSLVHGLADLWLNGALPTPAEPGVLIAEVTRRLQFGPRAGA